MQNLNQVNKPETAQEEQKEAEIKNANLKDQNTQTSNKPATSGFKVKQIHILSALVIIVLLVVIYLVFGYNSVPTVIAGDTIKVYYTGTLQNGTVFDSNVGKQPLVFTVGSGQVIKGFDQGVLGMKLHQQKILVIPANQAYGPRDPKLVIPIPRSDFGNQSITTGMYVSKSSNGQQIRGIVIAVNQTFVTADFNSPLAGQTLIFNVTVIQIQNQT